MTRYTICAFRGSEGEQPSYKRTASTLREARSIAWDLAHKVRCTTSRPVWVDGASSWNDETVVGGYDAGGDVNPGGACAVVHRGEVA